VDGLDLLQPGAKGFLRYQHDAGDASTLRDSYIQSLYQDPSGLVWIGTRSGGVSRWNPRSWEMGVARPEWLREQSVMAFAGAPGRNIWVASLAGLFRYDTQTGVATPIDRVVGRANALGDRRVMSLHEDRYGSLWIGTMTEGLKRLRPDNRIQPFPVKTTKRNATSAAGIMSMAESRDGHIWLGTFEGGLNILDPITDEIRRLPYHGENGGTEARPGELSNATVTAILEDRQGNMWLGTGGGGLNVADSHGRVLRVFHTDPANPRGLPSDFIYSLTLDAEGRVWVGTDAGVARTQSADAAVDALQLVTVSVSRGQGSDVAYGIVSDQQGGMWISGNTGLMRLDPSTGASRVYHREDGLQGEEFSFGAIHRLRDGRLLFGGPGGFNIFDPSRLSASREPPALQLTRADVMGVPVQGAAPMWARPGLSLGYRANILSLDFSVLDFAAPEHSRLSYRLSGLTDNWIDVGAQRRITLTNLPAGDHVLEVRAASADSPWSAKPLRFALHRDPAPWRTPWAYATYALIIALLIGARVRNQRRKFRDMERARDHLESQVRERTSELVESNRQLEEAARAKSDFLDRMSHELRTPMNGVVGMTELLSRTTLSATQTHLTKTIRASAQILLQIVNDLLDLSKIRAGKVALEALPVDLGQVLEECTSLFAGAAETKGLELIVCPPASLRRGLRGDPLRVRQILMNLVGNAVKFTARGEIVVRADVEQLDEARAMVRLSVTDTGIGIDPAVLAKIFEPFTQADEKTTRQFGGTGLGLSICRELADLMGGRINVESRQQIGSTFS
ncbi:MAG TPA: two-component regulator propeller domain-containing protein, partial [Steroidobacteraceae bacterium]|nr:two-component regulator propeller domain-containing protein [Steroidobacteraceae bacterium]